MPLDILRAILPAAAVADDGADAQRFRETLTTAAAVTAAVLIVAFIAVLMGMT